VLAFYSLYFGLILVPPSDCAAISHTSIIFIAIMSRIFLAEKLAFAHLLALLLTILGVGFISKPSFLFQSNPATPLNQTVLLLNATDGDR
jgi:drug/metabolite transporter (DMT)-like permease